MVVALETFVDNLVDLWVDVGGRLLRLECTVEAALDREGAASVLNHKVCCIIANA